MKIGIDLGGSHISFGIIDDQGNILRKMEKDFTREEKENLGPVVEEFIIQKYNEVILDTKVEKMGIAIPGTVKDGVVVKSVNLKLCDYPIVSNLSKHIDIPIQIRNDGKCATLAEYKYGGLSEYNNVLFLCLGTGIGGGYIYNGMILESNVFPGTEFGHMVIEKDGRQCKCGKRGCFEKYGSMKVFKDEIKQTLNLQDNLSGDEIRAAIRENEEKVKDIKENFINNVAIGISNLINLFEPEIIVVGGGFSHYDYMFLEPIKERIINSDLLFNRRNSIDIRIAKLGNDAGIIGAV